MQRPTNLWTIMLSGGNGERLRPFIRRVFGRDLAKQYCAFLGNRTMFESTADRARMLAPPQQNVAVVAQSHLERGWVGQAQIPEGKLLAQPFNHDTGPGALLPLAYVRRKEPDAVVVILPCDHFVYPEHRFTEDVRNAVKAVEAFPERLVLLGASPKLVDADLGWIELGPPLPSSSDSDLRQVNRFVEKPPADEAARIMRAGGLLNTMIIAARLDSLWSLARRHFPDTIALFERLENAFDTDRERDELRQAYREMPSWNLSQDLLGRCPSNLAVMELDGVEWNDWGRPERILETMRHLRPADEPIWSTELLSLTSNRTESPKSIAAIRHAVSA